MTKDSGFSEKTIYRLFEITPIPTILSFPDGKLEYVNSALKKLLGYQGDDIYNDSVVITHESDLEVNKEIRKQLLHSPFEPVQIEKRYKHKDGRTIYAQLNIVAQANSQGIVERYISHIIDLSAVKKADAAELLLTRLVDSSTDAIYVVDAKYGQFLSSNHLGYHRLGYSKKALMSMTVADLHPEFKDEIRWQAHVNKIKEHKKLVLESEHRKANGEILPIEAGISFATLNGKEYLLAIVRDISQRKAQQASVIEQLNQDPLTKLPNRRVLNDKLAAMIEQSRNSKKLLAVIYVDIDNFKDINDAHGHTIGDKILIGVAGRLTNSVRKSDIVSRIGGDEFLIAIGQLSSSAVIESMVGKLLSDFSAPFGIDDQLINVAASFGVSVLNGEDYQHSELIDFADKAMYQAKYKQGTAVVFNKDSE